MKEEYEVVIIGAGPAGTCAALRLLQLGYEVAIIEQSIFPRPQIGESLSPGIWNIFEYLDAEHLLQKPTYLRDLPAHVIWETPAQKRMDASERGPGVVVDRGQLDQDLIHLCNERGATVFQPAKLESCEWKDGRYHLKLKTKDGKAQLRASFVFDARGRNGVPKAIRIQTAPLSVAIWAHIPAKHLPEATLIEAMEDAWLWGSPLPDGSYRIMAFTDPESVKNTQVANCLKALIQESNLFYQEDAAVLKSMNCQTCPVQSYWNAKAWKENYVHIGESAFALDPLSSTGVEKAMRFSLQAVIAFNTIVKKKDYELAKTFYKDKLLKAVATHTEWTKDFYAQSWINSENTFWAKRSAAYRDPKWQNTVEEKQLTKAFRNIMQQNQPLLNPNISVSEVLERLNGAKLRVSPTVTFKEMPCVTDDCVELKQAVNHPNLTEPFAYLGEIEISPLLQSICQPEIINTIINQWATKVGWEKGIRLVFELYRQGVLEYIED